MSNGRVFHRTGGSARLLSLRVAPGESSSRASPARTSMPTQGGESRIIINASPGGAADPPVRASHLRRDKPIDGKRSQCRATRLTLQEQELKVLFRWAT